MYIIYKVLQVNEILFVEQFWNLSTTKEHLTSFHIWMGYFFAIQVPFNVLPYFLQQKLCYVKCGNITKFNLVQCISNTIFQYKINKKKLDNIRDFIRITDEIASEQKHIFNKDKSRELFLEQQNFLQSIRAILLLFYKIGCRIGTY